MRDLLRRTERLPAPTFVAAAALLLGLCEAAWRLALVRGHAGAAALAIVPALLVGLGVLAMAVCRRQADAWTAAIHLVAVRVASQVVALLAMLPFLPPEVRRGAGGMSFGQTVAAGLALQVVGAALVGLPVALAVVWLLRRVADALPAPGPRSVVGRSGSGGPAA